MPEGKAQKRTPGRKKFSGSHIFACYFILPIIKLVQLFEPLNHSFEKGG
jgi:hypothetical protein